MPGDWYFKIAIPFLLLALVTLTAIAVWKWRKQAMARFTFLAKLRIDSPVAHLLEVAIILPLLAGALVVLSKADNSIQYAKMVELLNSNPIPAPGSRIDLGDLRNLAYALIAAMASFLPLLLMVRQQRWRWLALAAALLVVFGPAVPALQSRIPPEEMAKLMSFYGPNQGGPVYTLGLEKPILIPTAVSFLRPIPILMLSFAMAALGFRGPRWSIPILGGVAAAAIGRLCYWFAPPDGFTRAYASFFAAGAMFSGALLVLPLQRRAMERHLGFSSEDASAGPKPWPWLCGSLAGVAIILLIASVPCFAMLSLVEARTIRSFVSPIAPHRSLAELNAWPILRDRFDRKDSLNQKWRGWDRKLRDAIVPPAIAKVHPEPVEQLLYTATSAPFISTLLQESVRREISADGEQNREYIDRMRGALEADYLSSFHDGRYETPSFLVIREVARHLCRESAQLAVDGRYSDARERAELVLNLGCMLRDGTLVVHMIGTAVRSLAIDALIIQLHQARNDREAVQGIRELLAKYRSPARRSLDVDNLARYEAGFRPIVPYSDVAIPSMGRAITVYYRNVARYDMLELAAALEAYRLDKGDYPDTLGPLLGGYLERLPLDPFRGRDYVYTKREGFFELSLSNPPAAMQKSEIPSLVFPVPLPPGVTQ